MIIFLLIVIGFIAVVYLYMQQPIFGKAATGARLARMQQSPHYKNGQFQNQSPTPALTEGYSYTGVIKKFLFERKEQSKPEENVPTQKQELKQIDPAENVLVWFGHSSYYLQLDGKRILVDPVLSGHASPLKFTTPSFKGTDVYTVDDLPPIDYLFLSHDHYDHLDYETIVKLQPKVKKVITGLGVGAHLEHWGYSPAQLVEKDWYEEETLDPGFVVHTAPARHFSGRRFKRNETLWLSFVLITPTRRIYLGGDSGYDTHFKTIGDKFGPFDLVILENGQYDPAWKYIHMMPEETVQAAIDLKAKRLLPVHWSKFALANHSWREPAIRVQQEADRRHMPLLLPMIGEVVKQGKLNAPVGWWEAVQ
ncbi:MBL fold metallo-hydrolase [Flavisolibacter tropicus]|uniref:Beta-lactamase n=1 Tax=Flavisolibacter tropicus TaxID=1492898 RepID=A0A172TWW2_9BACT|nr:MBL fold metallo-hydrolase [Flavisolibacter tropicus]ANE51579.1 beta-lactamase [Flavisolibacter tropicus]